MASSRVGVIRFQLHQSIAEFWESGENGLDRREVQRPNLCSERVKGQKIWIQTELRT